MRTNIDLDEDLLNQVKKITGARTKREAVHAAMRELVAARKRRGILALAGKVQWTGDLDRSRRSRV